MLGRILLAGILVCALAFASDRENTNPQGRKLWLVSLAAIGAATAADTHSSWGKVEVNPMLRGPDGRFGTRGAAFKSGIVGANLAIQWLLQRRWPSAQKRMAITNFGLAGGLAGIAARNYGVPPPKIPAYLQ